MTEKIIKLAIIVIGTMAVIAIVMGLPTMWLWNWLMPDLFEISRITFWQAIGLNMLAGILFRSSSGSTSKSN